MSEIEYHITQSFHTHRFPSKMDSGNERGGSRYKGRRSGMGSGAQLPPPPPRTVSDVTRQRSVVLMSLAASGHLAHDAVCFISLLSPLPVCPCWGGRKSFFFCWGPNKPSVTLKMKNALKENENISVWEAVKRECCWSNTATLTASGLTRQ